jgi:hypothetical protein
MRYVIAGYIFVLGLLALYAVALVWRRRRLVRAVARVTGPDVAVVVVGGNGSPGASTVAGAPVSTGATTPQAEAS